VAAPRVTVEPDGWFAPPVAVLADGPLAPGVAVDLRRRGHRLEEVAYDRGLGHEHAIELVDGGPAAGGTLAAVADARSAGMAAVR
jgi:gamma-glutamyltranspeptidase